MNSFLHEVSVPSQHTRGLPVDITRRVRVHALRALSRLGTSGDIARGGESPAPWARRGVVNWPVDTTESASGHARTQRNDAE